MIYLGIGSNLPSTFGDRFDNINFAVEHLKKHQIEINRRSSFYETPSYPNQENPKFINIVINIKTSLSLKDLILAIIDTEKKLKRKRKVKNDPRTCDIDIIDYKGQVLISKYFEDEFIVPHRYLSLRSFVLLPLYEICPEWQHPSTNETVTELINKLPKEDKKTILKIKKN